MSIFNNPLFPKRVKDKRADKSEDYAVKHSKTVDIVLRVLSVLAAVLIWIYAVSTDGAIKTASFEIQSSEITFVGAEDWEAIGYRPAVDDFGLSFTVQGRKSDISSFDKTDADLYVYLVGEDSSTIFKINVKLPKGLTLTSITPEYITVHREPISASATDLIQ